MFKMQATWHHIWIGNKVSYRVPNLGTVGTDYIDGTIVDIERSDRGIPVVIRLESRASGRFYTTVPRNIYI